MVENVALSLANGARKPNFTPAECAVIFQQKQKSKCDLYVSNYLCSFSNAVTEFASRTLEMKLLAGPIREGQREIDFIAR